MAISKHAQPSLALVCWSLFHSWGWLGLLHGHVGVDFSCGFFGAIFWCGFFFADFGVWISRGVMAWADFWDADFFCGFFGCFPAEKALKKSHQKIPPKILTKDLVQETFLHNTPPHSFWQSTADLLRVSGCRCTLWRTVFSAQLASVREDERVISTCV